MDNSSDSKTINQIIVDYLRTLDNNSIVILKGFNNCLSHIQDKLVFSGNLLDSDRISAQSVQSLMMQNDGTKFILYEDYLLMQNKQLSGLLGLSSNVYILNNDFYNLYYPSIADDEANEDIVKSLDSAQDNLLQIVYGDIKKSGEYYYVAYSDSNDNNTILAVNLSDAINGAIAGSNKPVRLPEEYDAIVLSHIVYNILDGEYDELIVTDTRANDSVIKSLLQKLAKFGVKTSLQPYQAQDKPIDQTRLECYVEILKRKNPTYNFRKFKAYKNPYESAELYDVSQATVIDDIVNNALLATNRQVFRDVFCTAPTGAGKSVMFQIPAIYLAEHYDLVTLVITPLIGLMNDQVNNIGAMTDMADTINSDFTPMHREEVLNSIKSGNKSILYLSPESLLANSDISTLIGNRRIGLLVVDEAHIVATWGKSFRPDYWYLGDFIDKLRNTNKGGQPFPIVAFTATATFGGEDNMYDDIVESLKMTPNKYIGDIKRPDIEFNIHLQTKDIAYREEKLQTAANTIANLACNGDKVLVYVPYKKHIGELSSKLTNKGVKFAKYYGGMEAGAKNEAMQKLKNGEVNVILATKAFGMGIDIDDIKYIYHFAPTGGVEDYVQEIGRAARKPGMTGAAVTDFYKEDFRYVNQLYGMSAIKNYQIVGTLQKIYSLFKKYGQRNFLVSPSEFSYLFADALNDSSVDVRLKTALLMIRKDFEFNSPNSFPPIIFKPQSMFTRGYFTVNDDMIDFLDNLGLLRYFKNKHLPRTIVEYGTGGVKTTTRLPGDTYELDFKGLWEDHYQNLSFGRFKYEFMTNSLNDIDFRVGEKLLSKVIVKINSLDGSLYDSLHKLLEFTRSLSSCLADMKQANKYFGATDLAQSLSEKGTISSRYRAESVSQSIIPMLDKLKSNNIMAMSFYERRNDKFIVKNSTYDHKLNTLSHTARACMQDANGYQLVKFARESNEPIVVLAQLLELLGYAETQIMSGDRPQFFIRVNSPYAIEKIINNENYYSHMVRAVGERHKRARAIMQRFFTTMPTSKEKWDFIEKYFLGKID